MIVENLFSNIPNTIFDEIFDKIIQTKNITIENDLFMHSPFMQFLGLSKGEDHQTPMAQEGLGLFKKSYVSLLETFLNLYF